MIFKRIENIEYIFKIKTGVGYVFEMDSVYVVISEAKKIVHKFSILSTNRHSPTNIILCSDLGIVNKLYRNLL